MDRMSKLTARGAGDRGRQGYADPINSELGAAVLADEGSTHGWTTAFRTGVKRRHFIKKLASEQWILSCKSLGRSLVHHL